MGNIYLCEQEILMLVFTFNEYSAVQYSKQCRIEQYVTFAGILARNSGSAMCASYRHETF